MGPHLVLHVFFTHFTSGYFHGNPISCGVITKIFIPYQTITTIQVRRLVFLTNCLHIYVPHLSAPPPGLPQIALTLTHATFLGVAEQYAKVSTH